jgi:hypothetical protein
LRGNRTEGNRELLTDGLDNLIFILNAILRNIIRDMCLYDSESVRFIGHENDCMRPCVNHNADVEMEISQFFRGESKRPLSRKKFSQKAFLSLLLFSFYVCGFSVRFVSLRLCEKTIDRNALNNLLLWTLLSRSHLINDRERSARLATNRSWLIICCSTHGDCHLRPFESASVSQGSRCWPLKNSLHLFRVLPRPSPLWKGPLCGSIRPLLSLLSL